ncbi:MAG: matrixin family metalloprotease [Myxococcota bacterium]
MRTAGEWDALGRGTNEIAVTFIASNDKTGEIVDADIAVNDARWRLTIGGFASGEVDLVSTMTHEVGHALGLEHSDQRDATMFATYTNEDPTGARTLSDDDRAGLCAIYADVPDHLSGRLVEGCAAAPEAGLGGLGLALWLWRRGRAATSRPAAAGNPPAAHARVPLKCS